MKKKTTVKQDQAYNTKFNKAIKVAAGLYMVAVSTKTISQILKDRYGLTPRDLQSALTYAKKELLASSGLQDARQVILKKYLEIATCGGATIAEQLEACGEIQKLLGIKAP